MVGMINDELMRAADQVGAEMDARMLAIARLVTQNALRGFTPGGSGSGGAPFQFFFQNPAAGSVAWALALAPLTIKSVVTVTNISLTLLSFRYVLEKATMDPALTLSMGPPGQASNPFVSLLGTAPALGLSGVASAASVEQTFLGWDTISLLQWDLLQVRLTTAVTVNTALVVIDY